MSEREESHDSQLDREGQRDGEEVVFREGVPNVESSTPSTHNVSPQMVTTDDLQEVIEGWKTKFQHLSEAANKSDMTVHGMCSLELSVHGLIIHIDTVVVDLNCQAILGMDILGDATKLPFILDLVDGTLSGGGYETIQLHRFHAATECFAETTDTVCIPPHLEVMLWAKLKTNNGRRGPTAGVVLALQTFVQEFGILVGRSLVRADADDWKVPILLYNSDPCTKRSKDCKCNPVIIPARTRIARVEEIQAKQHIGTRETERSAGECALPPHLIDVLDAASELTSDQRARS